MRRSLTILFLLVAAPLAGAGTWQEDFSSDPAADGWQVAGDTNLFQWDPVRQALDVTWDSSQTNSYFYHPLGTILAGDDSFQLSFDLSFQDYANGSTPGKPYDFPAAIGFLTLSNALRPGFARGSGINPTSGAVNLVEFDFFPAFYIYRPTIAQIIVSTNDAWLYNHDNLLDLTTNEWFHIAMDYEATNRTLTTVVTNNGSQYGVTQTIGVPANFDFREDVIALSSYSDQQATGSILAHGTVRNLVVIVPPSPVQWFQAGWSNQLWQAEFEGRTNWLYSLQRTGDFLTWSNVSSISSGTATSYRLLDTNPFPERAFYRLQATRP